MLLWCIIINVRNTREKKGLILMFGIQQVCTKCKGILIPLEDKERVEVTETDDMVLEFKGYDTFECVCCGHQEERRVF